MAESAVPGVVLGALFPVLFFIIPGGYIARSTTPVTPRENLIPAVIFAVAGCLTSMAFGYAFRRRLITPSVA
jgi:membrane protein DedA with SNARE-associated domain